MHIVYVPGFRRSGKSTILRGTAITDKYSFFVSANPCASLMLSHKLDVISWTTFLNRKHGVSDYTLYVDDIDNIHEVDRLRVWKDLSDCATLVMSFTPQIKYKQYNLWYLQRPGNATYEVWETASTAAVSAKNLGINPVLYGSDKPYSYKITHAGFEISEYDYATQTWNVLSNPPYTLRKQVAEVIKWKLDS